MVTAGPAGLEDCRAQEPPLPAGQAFPVALPGPRGAWLPADTPSTSRGVVGLLAQEQKRPGQAVIRDRGDGGAVHVDAGPDAGVGQHGGEGGGAPGGVARHRHPGWVDQRGARPGRVCAGQFTEHEADIRGPACRHLLASARAGCLTGQAGGDPPIGKGRGVTLVRVINSGHDVAVAGQVLGQGGERAAGHGEARREHDQGKAARTPGRCGVADRAGPDRAQHVLRHAGQAPARQEEPGLHWRHIPGSRPVRGRRRIPQGDHQFPCAHPGGPGIGTRHVFQVQGRGTDQAGTGRLRQVRRVPRPGRRVISVCGRSHAANPHRPGPPPAPPGWPDLATYAKRMAPPSACTVQPAACHSARGSTLRPSRMQGVRTTESSCAGSRARYSLHSVRCSTTSAPSQALTASSA